jgi:hypothetical protein
LRIAYRRKLGWRSGPGYPIAGFTKTSEEIVQPQHRAPQCPKQMEHSFSSSSSGMALMQFGDNEIDEIEELSDPLQDLMSPF